MCVIMATKDKPIPEEWITKGFEANNHGAGAAWREDGYVHWKKGLDLDQIQELAAKLTPPYILHFRIQTVGGVRPELTHPFPIEPTVNLALEGKTKGYVLFHNGGWSNWKSDAKIAASDGIKNGRAKAGLPIGKWSDTRAMAFMAHVYGLGILEFIDEKVMAFSPDKVDVFGSPWTLLDGIWVSNTNWQSRSGNSYHRKGNAEDVRNAYSDRRSLPPAQSPLPALVKPAVNEDKPENAVGGQPAESPFERANRRLTEALDLFARKVKDNNGQPVISKNELKRRQRQVDIEARRMNNTKRTATETRH